MVRLFLTADRIAVIIIVASVAPVATQSKLQMWWNWQTRHLEGVVSSARAGSSPAICTRKIGDIDAMARKASI